MITCKTDAQQQGVLFYYGKEPFVPFAIHAGLSDTTRGQEIAAA